MHNQVGAQISISMLMTLRFLILAAVLLLEGCVSSLPNAESIKIDPTTLEFFPDMCILGLGPKWAGQPFIPDSTLYGKTVQIRPDPNWDAEPLVISFDTISLNRSSGILTIVGKVALKRTGEVWASAMIAHVAIGKSCKDYHGESIDAKFVDATSTDSNGLFRISFVPSSGDLLEFVDVGAKGTICCINLGNG